MGTKLEALDASFASASFQDKAESHKLFLGVAAIVSQGKGVGIGFEGWPEFQLRRN
jgi:hypothetical protein